MNGRTLAALAAVGWWITAGGGIPVTGNGPLTKTPYAADFNQAGAAHGVDPALIAGLCEVESSWQPAVVSHKGAIGLCQFMPATAEAMRVDPWDPASSIDGAARYLANSHRIHGNWREAIAAYNAGDPAVTRIGETAADGTYVNDVLAAAQQQT